MSVLLLEVKTRLGGLVSGDDCFVMGTNAAGQWRRGGFLSSLHLSD
jgi:hypothetical protein